MNIEEYYDGYKACDINCIDLPLAACAGKFDCNYYYIYCLCYCYILNWNLYEKESDWYSIRKSLLSYLGLNFIKKYVDNSTDLKQEIEKELSQDNPIFCIVKYGSLFYSKYYHWGTYDHGLIICDFDSKKKILSIRDREIAREYIDNGIFSADILFKMQITYQQLSSIWRYSNALFAKEESEHCKCLYTICKNTYFDNNDYMRVVKNIVGNAELKSQIYNYITDINQRMEKGQDIDMTEMEAARRLYYKSFFVFKDVIERYILKDNMLKETKFQDLFNIFIAKRQMIIDEIQVQCMRKRKMDMDYVKHVLNEDMYNFSSIRNFLLNG